MYTRTETPNYGALLILAIGCFCWFGYHWYVSNDSLKWPAQVGQISEVKIDVQTSKGHPVGYTPTVFYHFVHNHVSFEGSEPLNQAPSMQSAQQSASLWQHGQHLQIYFNPDNPHQSSLHQGEHLHTDAVIAIVAFLIIAGTLTSLSLPLTGSSSNLARQMD